MARGGQGQRRRQFSNNKVRVASLDLPLEQVQGRSSMTTSRRAFSNLKASLWNQPLTLDYQGRQQPNRYQVDLKFQGAVGQPPPAPGHTGPRDAPGRSNWAGSLGLTLPERSAVQLPAGARLQPAGHGAGSARAAAKAAGSRLPLKVTARGRDGMPTSAPCWGPTWTCRAAWCTATACPTSAGCGWTSGSPAPG
jgi:uncharacterized protein YhdP